jgi:hypothetical protein
MAGIELRQNLRTLLLLFFQAALERRHRWPPPGWNTGPLRLGETDHRSKLLPAIQRAVMGALDSPIRWHLNLESAPLAVGSGCVIAVEALRLTGLSGSYVIVVHVAIEPSCGIFQGYDPPFDMGTALKDVIGPAMVLLDGWGGSHVQHPAASPTPVSELIVAPDNPAALPKPNVVLSGPGCNWNEYEYRSYWFTRDEAEPTPDMIMSNIRRTFPVGGGTLLVGGYRSVAENDSYYENRLRTFVLDAMLFSVAQNVMLNGPTHLALGLANPRRDPSTARAMSRGIVAYRSLYAWTGGSVLGPDRQVIEDYRKRTGLELLEKSLTSFEYAAQSAITAQTNDLLGLIAVFGLAATIALAVKEAVGWHGWAILWAVLIAIAIVSCLLLLPLGRALRTSIFDRARVRG